jgi:hypothetical protein
VRDDFERVPHSILARLPLFFDPAQGFHARAETDVSRRRGHGYHVWTTKASRTRKIAQFEAVPSGIMQAPLRFV